MTTLHTVTEVTKKIFVGFAIGIASIVFLFLLVRFITHLKEYLFPTPPAPPTVSFGKLPAFSFPKSLYTDTFSYTLTTISGNLPAFPDRIKVYKLNQPQPSLLNFDTVKNLVTRNNFSDNPTQLSETLYSWQQSAGLQQKITFDIVSFDFSLTSPGNYLTDQNVINANFVPSESDAIEKATTFFQNFSSFPDDLDSSKTQVTYFTIKNGTLVLADNFSSRQVAFVDFYQQDVNNLPILYPNFPTSLMHAVIASGPESPEIKEAQYTHKTVLTDTTATYPLKTAAQAFEELKQHKAYIAHYDGDNQSVTIRNAFLAYYIGKDPQQYLYPIIVFQGDNNFYAFVSAITNEWLGK